MGGLEALGEREKRYQYMAQPRINRNELLLAKQSYKSISAVRQHCESSGCDGKNQKHRKYQGMGWTALKVWILRGEKSRSKCTSTSFLMLSKRNLNAEIRLRPEQSHRCIGSVSLYMALCCAWLTWQMYVAHCPISAMIVVAIFLLWKWPQPDVGPLASKIEFSVTDKPTLYHATEIHTLRELYGIQ